MLVSKKWVLPQIFNGAPEKYSKIIAQILYTRGIKGEKAIKEFLESDFSLQTHDPFKFRDMQKAVDTVIKAIIQQKKIIIYGDYDADGVTSSAVMAETLTTLKAIVDVYIPDRFKEGYGLNKEVIEKFAKEDCKLLITVDGGIKNKDEVEIAKSLGLEVIITDHHTAPENKKDLPNCLIINPEVPGEKYPFKKLSGVGVAFKFAQAIISKTKLQEKDKQTLTHRVLDLVAIGTIADCVPLIDENRVLSQKGIELINEKKQRVGIQELIKTTGVNYDSNKKITSENIAFQLAPRINAAGRMSTATTAFELMITRDQEEATSLALTLNEKNIQRQKETDDIKNKALGQIQAQANDKLIAIVCPDNEKWNEGIVGLTAGRLSDEYNKPTLVVARTEYGYKGSGRSVDGVNIMNIINESAEFLDKYGGHAGACGFSLKKENLEKFINKAKELSLKIIKDDDILPKVIIDALVELDEIDEKLVKDIDKLAPFGESNPQPILCANNLIVADANKIGLNGDHIKLKVTNGRSSLFNAIAFYKAKEWGSLTIGDRIDMAFKAEINKFNGHSEVQLKIVDIRK